MNSNENKLEKIPRKDWINLRDMYVSDWPKNIVGYSTLNNFIKWVTIDPKIENLEVYSLNGDWSDGTFLIVDRYQLFLNTLNNSNERLQIALSLLDWSKGFKVSTFLERHRSAVVNIVEIKELKKEYDSKTVIYYLPKSLAKKLQINCPDDIILKTMTEEDAVIANKHWPNQHEGSEFFLKRLANWNINIGAYSKKDNELVAWCLRLQAGPLGALQTKDSHMRKGLGSLVTRAMVHKLAEINEDTFACVGMENIASQKMFEKLGFQIFDYCFWLRTFPSFDFHWKD